MEKTPRKNQKQYPKDPPVSFYLGKGEIRERRIAMLVDLAEQLADGKPTRLLQDIADGKIKLVKEPA